MRIAATLIGFLVALSLVVALAWRRDAVQPGGESSNSATAAARTVECTADALSAHVPADTTITGAVNVPPQDGLPAYCQVDARVTTPGNAVNVRVRLPASWNGRFLFHGVGGYAGSVEPPIPPNVAAADAINSKAPGLRRGYAVASTDTGHQGGGTDASWALNDRAKEIDYAHRGVHVATVAGKALTTAFYGSMPTRAYFAGCSGGGRQALIEAQRYPADFDGIIAGAPAVGTTGIHRTLVFQTLLANADAYIPASKLETISNAVLAACDASDGVEDGLVSNPPACRFQPETLVCREGDHDDCLTAGQVATLKKLYAGFSTKDGRSTTQGFPVGHESAEWARWLLGTARRSAGRMAR